MILSTIERALLAILHTAKPWRSIGNPSFGAAMRCAAFHNNRNEHALFRTLSHHAPIATILVVGDGVEEVVVTRVEARVDHASEDTEHGGTSVLDLDIEGAVAFLGVFDLGLEWVSSRDGVGGSIVTSWKILGSSGVFAGRHGDNIGESGEQDNLDDSEGRNGGNGRESHTVVEDRGERNISLKIEGSGEGDSEFLDQHTNEGNHGDASVLDFDGTTAGEGFGILGKSKRIEKVKRTRVDSESIGGSVVTVDGGGDTRLLGRGKGGGGGGKGGKDDKLHVWIVVVG